MAAHIGPGLAKAALAAVVNGETVGLMEPIVEDAEIQILTDRDLDALPVLRHSAAHILATSVRELRPEAAIGFGPAIDDGFYYDFEVDEPFTPEDLEAFERKMADVAAADQMFERRQVSKSEARDLFNDDPLKLERLEEFDDDEVITVYENGPFLDLCKGPHIKSTGGLKHFKLTSAAGAYWRGDEKRQMLQRIYGTAWTTDKELNQYLLMIEEAEKRDHRKIGKAQKLFHIQEEATGSIFWHPSGWSIYQEIEAYVRRRLKKASYQEVKTPPVSYTHLTLPTKA